jgi:hypothetical protein
MTEIELLAAPGRAARTKSKTCCARWSATHSHPRHPGVHPRLMRVGQRHHFFLLD